MVRQPVFATVLGGLGAMAQTTDWRCGHVQNVGKTWIPDANPDCNGTGTIDHNKCWLRRSVRVWECDSDADYDYYWLDKFVDPPVFEKFHARNCYAGAGIPPGLPSQYGKGAQFLNLGACKKECLDDDMCEGIIVESPYEEKADQELEIERCWLRAGIQLSFCDNGSAYDTFLHTKEQPADFSQHYAGVNCYPNAGSRIGYGDGELRYLDGTLVSHLGDCKAACHSDSTCEGITVLYLTEEERLFQARSAPLAKGQGTPLALAASAGFAAATLLALLVVAASRRRSAPPPDAALLQPQGASDEA